jgi:hypothetical protein
MTKYGHVAWRMAAVLAFAGTAVLAVTLTRAPAATRTALSSKVACPVSGLQAWLGLGAGTGSASGSAQPTDGGTYFTLEFTNVSHRTCSLYGYPRVSAYEASEASEVIGGQSTGAQNTGGQSAGSQTAGGQIGSAATPDAAVRPQPVTLPPGATAHAVLQVMGAGSTQPASCARVIAREIRVIPPDHGRSRGGATVFAVQIPVCAASGHTSLSVQAVRARAGIPGHPAP